MPARGLSGREGIISSRTNCSGDAKRTVRTAVCSWTSWNGPPATRDRTSQASPRAKKERMMAQQSVKGRIRKGHSKCVALLPRKRDTWERRERAGNPQLLCIVVQPDDLPSGTDGLRRQTCDDPSATGHIQHAFTWLEGCLLNEQGSAHKSPLRFHAVVVAPADSWRLPSRSQKKV